MSIIPLRDLLSEIIDSHSDPDNPDYNQCDVDPCAWCESAIVHIAEMVLRKIGGDAAYNPPSREAGSLCASNVQAHRKDEAASVSFG